VHPVAPVHTSLIRTCALPATAAPKPVWCDSAAEIADCRWLSLLPGAAPRTAAMRCRQRLAAACSEVASLLRWLFRHRMKVGENTAGTCSDLRGTTLCALACGAAVAGADVHVPAELGPQHDAQAHLRCGSRIVNSWKPRYLRSLEDVKRSPSTTVAQNASSCPGLADCVEGFPPATCARCHERFDSQSTACDLVPTFSPNIHLNIQPQPVTRCKPVHLPQRPSSQCGKRLAS
jgi:hypothetical protein